MNIKISQGSAATDLRLDVRSHSSRSFVSLNATVKFKNNHQYRSTSAKIIVKKLRAFLRVKWCTGRPILSLVNG